MPTHKTDSDGAIKKIKVQSKKQEKDELNKFYKKSKQKNTQI